jgi:hypothetical protein
VLGDLREGVEQAPAVSSSVRLPVSDLLERDGLFGLLCHGGSLAPLPIKMHFCKNLNDLCILNSEG